MYNQQQKEEFLNYYASIKGSQSSMVSRARIAFNKIEHLEQSWEKDISEENDIQKLTNAFDLLSNNSSGFNSGRIIAMRDYCRWCYDFGIITKSSKFLDIQTTTSNKTKDSTVGSPLELQMHLNACFDPENKENMHNVYRAFCWLAYMGFTESQAFRISTSDVDVENKVIIHDNMKLDIYEEAMASIINCKTLSYFRVDNPRYTKESCVDRVQGLLLLRGIRRNPGKYLNTEFSRMQTYAIRDNKIAKRLNYASIWRSGIFYWMFKQEQMGHEVKFDGFAILKWKDSREGRSDNLETEYNPSNKDHIRYVLRDIRTLKRDYKKWKEAHYNA